MKKTIIGFALGLSLALIPAPSFALSNDEFKIGISQEFENMNPIISTMAATSYIYFLCGRAPVSVDKNAKTYPQLVKSVPSLEKGDAKFVTVNGKKTIQATWIIKDEAKWSDGKPVICADFKLSREIADNPNVSVGEKETYTKWEKIECDEKNPKKMVTTYDKARWDFYSMPQTRPVPSHIEEEIYRKHANEKEGYEKNTMYAKNPTMDGLCNGPYKFSEVKLGSHVTLVPNPYFYGSKPKIQKLIIKLIPNTSTMEANLRSGTIDAISSTGITFDQALAMDKKVKSENLPFEVRFKEGLTYEHIDLLLDNPILQDLRVRKALVHAINREDLTKALFEGKQKPALHFIAPIDPWYTDKPHAVTKYPYSKRDAEKLLDEAGWKKGADGYRSKDGKKLTLQFMTTAGNKTRETVQTYLQGQWKQVGVEVVIKNEPARVFFGETTKKRKYGAMAMYAWISSPENTPKSTHHSVNIPSEKNGYSGQNQPGWNNPNVDKWIDQLEQEFNAKKRLELIHNITKAYTEEVPVIPLYYRAEIAVVPKALKNFELPGHQFAETNYAEKWEITGANLK